MPGKVEDMTQDIKALAKAINGFFVFLFFAMLAVWIFWGGPIGKSSVEHGLLLREHTDRIEAIERHICYGLPLSEWQKLQQMVD